MVQGIDAAIVRAWRRMEREAAQTGDRGRLAAVTDAVDRASHGDFLSTVTDKFSPSALHASASGDIKSPCGSILTD